MERSQRFQTTIVEVEGREETKVVELPAFEPEPWDAKATLTIVGQSVPRVDARAKVSGAARYTVDVMRPGMLHAVLVRARFARGQVSSIDLEAAQATPGFVDAITGDDLAVLAKPVRAGGVPLLSASVSYAGQPVCAVCAESPGAARAAAARVRLTTVVEQPVVTIEQATAAKAPAVRAGGNRSRSSPVIESRGDVAHGLREAEVVITREYVTPVQLHTAMEPHGAVAEWDGDRLTIWEGTQGVFRVRDDVAAAFGVSQSSVRVLMDHMGGGFGAKNGAGAHTYVAAILARRTGRPVRCVLDRDGEQTDTGNRPMTRTRVTLGAMRDGRLTAIDVASEVAMGVGGWEAQTTKIFHELYRCPNVRSSDVFIYVNSQAMCAFRGPGHVEGAFAQERAMDELAKALGMDPLALRRRNLAERDQEKDRPYSGGSLGRCYDEGARRFGWEDRARRNDVAGGKTVTDTGEHGDKLNAGGTRVRRGCGMAAQIWPTGGGPPAYATVRLEPDGTVLVLAGTQDLGTGARTILAQVAAEALGARLEDVRVVLGDTERTPYTGNSWGSMTTPSVAPAVRMAAEDAKQHLLEAAAEMLDCSPDDLIVRNGMVDRRDCTRHVAIRDVTQKLGHVMIMGHGSRGPNQSGMAFATVGAQFAEVEVDADTGVVRVLRIVAAHDCGRVINPMLARSQLEGGILQGIGLALFEERVIDTNLGQPLSVGTHDYKIPTMADSPAIDAFCVGEADPAANHVGSRGLAEPPLIPAAPAIANAVADALGIEVSEIPLAPWRVLAALRDAACPGLTPSPTAARAARHPAAARSPDSADTA